MKIFEMVQGLFLRLSRISRIMQNLVFYVKLLTLSLAAHVQFGFHVNSLRSSYA